ncbi:MAG: DUF692 domain-containing protein [Alphaproteobacteria bacterium]|nr:DUF692 domain-containing protein [Alphaproteobacteria bacterium]
MLKTKKLVGVGLRQPHYTYVLENKPAVGWFEVHSENFFGEGGPALMFLEKIRETYPLSFHGVGLSLGSADGIDKTHLKILKKRIDRFSPFLVSEHLSWSKIQGRYLPDLLPIPYTKEVLHLFSQHVDETQTYLGREILIENPSSYLEYKCSTFSETDFLSTLCRATGAKILLDVNNVYVSAFNHGWNPRAYLQAIPPDLVGEIHLAGHSSQTFAGGATFLVDTHSTCVCEEVWALYQQAIQQGIYAPVLIEWDEDIPDFATLKAEALKAESYLPQERIAYG